MRDEDRLPSNVGKGSADTGEGTADNDRLSLWTVIEAEASPDPEEGDSVPCSSWGKLERRTLDVMRLNEVPEEPEPHKPEALYKNDDT